MAEINANPTAVVAADLRRIRAEISDLRAAIRETEAAPPTDGEVGRHAAAVVDRLATRARASLAVELLAAGDADGRLGEVDELLAEMPAAEMLALVDGPKLAKALAAAAIASRSGAPMSAAERRSRVAELLGGIGDLERAEEAAIRSAERAGHAVARRGDADPGVVLQPDPTDEETDR